MPTRSPKKTSGKPAGLEILRAKNLEALPWLTHGFSTRVGGFSRAYGKADLNLGFTQDDRKVAVERNRAAFLSELNSPSVLNSSSAKSGSSPSWGLVTLRQFHSDLIHHVDSISPEPLAGDGMVTATPGLMLAIQTADCLPIILADSNRHAVGVFHAGWRGTVKRIAEKGVGQMRGWFGSKPRDLKAAIGPGIYGCCFEVGEEVRQKFESQFAYAGKLFRERKDSDPVREKYPLLFLTARAPGHSELPNRIFVDLVEANRRQLIDAGVPAKNVEASGLCTKCNPGLLFSYRGENGKTGRLMGVAGIRP